MSTTESPAPKSRGRHRANKSASHITPPTPSKPQFHNHNAQHVPRTVNNIVTPPQSPKAQQQSPGNTSNKKNKRKPKPKPRDVNTTEVHANTHHGYDSPTFSSSNDESNGFPPSPTRGVLSTPTKAYAGPNFHSSPNPASLPVPSWFSKSVPSTPSAGTSLQAMLELSEENLSHSLEEPESHLQKLFRADKEEKAKKASSRSLETLSPDSSDSGLQDVFTMDNDIKPSGAPAAPYEVSPQALFRFTEQVPKSQFDARKQTDALRSFLNQPSPVTVDKAQDSGATQTPAPFTPAKRRSSPPQHGNHPPQFQTPKKSTSQPTNHGRRQSQFVLTPPRGPKGHQSSHPPQTPSPARSHNQQAPPTYTRRNDNKTDSVLQLTEMELYLRRVLNLESRAIATPAVAS